MDQVAEGSADLVTRCQQILSAEGKLAALVPGFISREQQMTLAQAIAQAIVSKTTLVAEAGTGTGKTFAYLVACVLSGKKALISTATKTLQDQLFNKDLPVVLRALGVSLRVQNLKGRANYLCHYRTELHAQEGRFAHPACANDLIHVRERLPLLRDGERHELPEIHEDSPVWPYVTSSADNCLGAECPYHATCFLIKARKRALEADLVVINHHLYFADSRLKDDGFGEILPGVSTVIFDEAHQLAEIAAHFHGQRVSTRQWRDVMDDVLREWPVLDLVNQPLQQLSIQLDDMMDALLNAYTLNASRSAWDDVRLLPAFMSAWQNFLAWGESFGACFAHVDLKEQLGLARCHTRFQELYTVLQTFQQASSDHIRWVESFKHTLVFHLTPFDIQKVFQSLLSRQETAYIFTSATLTVAESFDCFVKTLGLSSAQTLLLPSPFDFQQQALLYLPRGLPDPHDEQYYDCLIKQALPVIEAFGGRCFFLFTSHRALRLVANYLSVHLKYPLLIQGDEAKPILLARFRESGHAVLLGTATFWEGVDVKGEALSCVIIDKIPFASPADPVMRARMAHVKSRGLSPFDELSLPHAVLALKQGVGRLIRDVQDRGVLMIADPRVTGREYGRFILASLPPMRKTRDEQTVLNFIDALELHETFSA